MLALLFRGGFVLVSRDNFDIRTNDPSASLCSVSGVEGVSESLVSPCRLSPLDRVLIVAILLSRTLSSRGILIPAMMSFGSEGMGLSG